MDDLLELEHAGWVSLCDGTGSDFYGELMSDSAVMVLANGSVLTRDNVVEVSVVENDQQPEHMKSIADAISEAEFTAYVPVTFESCEHVTGPFFHGTKITFAIGDEVAPGHRSNYHDGRVANHVYFAALLEPAIWGAELAVALGDGPGRERIYVVEPTGPFEDDPNVTNKRFPGNVTRSYRTRHPMRIIGEVESWEGHPPEILQGMLSRIAQLRAEGLDVIED